MQIDLTEQRENASDSIAFNSDGESINNDLMH
jgi:hypothetical protein